MINEETDLLTRVGPGTPMGNLLRQYWIPALMASELAEQDGVPLRVRLLGENLIAFRDTSGRVGLLADHCSHRGASLFFGRNEDDGLRCVYHGWKYDVSGRCVDMPNEPPESNFQDRIRHPSYPCIEQAGVIWAYLGPRAKLPGLPELEWLSLPDSHLQHATMVRECNWVQALEGDIDSSHVSFLHRSLRLEDDVASNVNRAREQSKFWEYEHNDRSPWLEVVPTEYGVTYGARRNAEADTYYWRIAQFLLPFFTMIPPIGPRAGVGTRIWVPIDDEHTMYWSVSANPLRPLSTEERSRWGTGAPLAGDYLPATSDWLGRWRLAANSASDYGIDRERQRTGTYTGITGTNLQDQAMTESMGPIYDRSREHLGGADAMIIQFRRRIADAAIALRDQGIVPPGVDDPSVYRVRPASVVLPREANWIKAAHEYLVSRPGVPVASI
ncbi:MAG TPA: Rieske 2Fe-2S domain-containing protein [Chloroflexota bacterium]|jgi:phenylpropionate dioxygenase-like ring-hydroxylating dioxygenase large terminal subunit